MKKTAILASIFLSNCSTSKPMSDRMAARKLNKVYIDCLGHRAGIESISHLKMVKDGHEDIVRRRLCRFKFKKPYRLGKDKLPLK